jgi:hypothetical protein
MLFHARQVQVFGGHQTNGELLGHNKNTQNLLAKILLLYDAEAKMDRQTSYAKFIFFFCLFFEYFYRLK